MQCTVQVGLGRHIIHFWDSVSWAKGFYTVSANCAFLGGKEELVITQLHNSGAQGLSLSSETTECAVKARLEGWIVKLLGPRYGFKKWKCAVHSPWRQELCIAQCQGAGLQLEG